MIEMLVVVVAGATVLLSLLMLCIGCKEKKEIKSNGTADHVSTNPTFPQDDGTRISIPEQNASISRCSSVSSHASVRITITNMAESLRPPSEKLDSPTSVSSMADRELPELPTNEDDEDHDYDVVDVPHHHKLLNKPSLSHPDYDTLDNIQSGDYSTLAVDTGAEPYASAEYATADTRLSISSKGEYATIGETVGARKPSYECLPELEAFKDTHKPSYECLPQLGLFKDPTIPRDMDRSHTIGGRGPPLRPFSEGNFATTDDTAKNIDKQRSGSERKARLNEDCVSVIYASINPEFRTNRQKSLEKKEQNYSIVSNAEPPLPENPYAMLDNLLEDLKIPNPDDPSDDRSHIYEDLENLRPNSQVMDDAANLSGTRKANPLIANSSPFAVTNISRTTSGASPITIVEVSDA